MFVFELILCYARFVRVRVSTLHKFTVTEHKKFSSLHLNFTTGKHLLIYFTMPIVTISTTLNSIVKYILIFNTLKCISGSHYRNFLLISTQIIQKFYIMSVYMYKILHRFVF